MQPRRVLRLRLVVQVALRRRGVLVTHVGLDLEAVKHGDRHRPEMVREYGERNMAAAEMVLDWLELVGSSAAD